MNSHCYVFLHLSSLQSYSIWNGIKKNKSSLNFLLVMAYKLLTWLKDNQKFHPSNLYSCIKVHSNSQATLGPLVRNHIVIMSYFGEVCMDIEIVGFLETISWWWIWGWRGRGRRRLCISKEWMGWLDLRSIRGDGEKLEAMEACGSWNANNMWDKTIRCTRKATREMMWDLRGKFCGHRGNWWWNADVQGKVEAKKVAYAKLVECKDEEERRTNTTRYM